MDMALTSATITSVSTDVFSQVFLDRGSKRLISWEILAFKSDASGFHGSGEWGGPVRVEEWKLLNLELGCEVIAGNLSLVHSNWSEKRIFPDNSPVTIE